MPSRRLHRALTSAGIAVSLLLAATHVPAQSADNSVREARAKFERGYALVEKGNYEAGIALFEEAYALRPHYFVLYNLGQAYAVSGRVVAALDAFERYLKEGGAQIDAERRSAVERAIAFHSQRVGVLELTGLADGTAVFLDGSRVGETPELRELRAVAGAHRLRAERSGSEPLERDVRVAGGERQKVELSLSAEAFNDYVVRCPIPDVELRVDGRPLGAVTERTLRLRSGAHRFEFSRSGYANRSVELAASMRTAVIDCELSLDVTHPDTAQLFVGAPAGARIHLDGSAFSGGPVAAGAHILEVSGANYRSEASRVRLAPRERKSLAILPERSRRVLAEQAADSTRKRRIAAYALGGGAVAAATAAIVLYVKDSADYRDWQNESRELGRRLDSDPGSVDAAEVNALLEEENRIRNRDTVAVGLTVLSGALGIGALTLGLWPDSTDPALRLGDRSATLRLRF